MTDYPLETRDGLPDALRVLAETLPRPTWESHPNFDGLTRFWMERHLTFRDLLSRLRSGSAGFLDDQTDPQIFGRETARYAGFLLNQLHEHHHIEDSHYFPQLAALDPRLIHGFDLLDRDHQTLDGHIRGLADTTYAMLAALDGDGARDAAGALDQSLGQFESFLNRHLLDEEDLVVPVILTHGGIG